MSAERTTYRGCKLVVTDLGVSVRAPDGRRSPRYLSMARARLWVRRWRKAYA